MSRVIIACQDGGRRSEIAAEMVTGMGYTAIATIEGGVEAYLKVSPLKEADLRPRVKRVQQEVGIKYGGTGVTSEQTPGALRRRGGAFPTPTVGAFSYARADARGCAPDRRQRVSFGFVCQHLLGERAQRVCPSAPHQAKHEPLGHRNRMRDPAASASRWGPAPARPLETALLPSP